jgi:hypothetical protein
VYDRRTGLLYKILEEQPGMLGIIDDNSAKNGEDFADCVVICPFPRSDRVKINAGHSNETG